MTKLEELEKLIKEAHDKVYSPSDCEGLLYDAIDIINKINKKTEKLYRTVGIRAYKLIPREVKNILLDQLTKKDKNQVKLLTYDIACAKKVLYLFERDFPEDNRPRKAIEAAEKLLELKIKNPRLGYEIAITKEYEEVNKTSKAAMESYRAAMYKIKYAARNAASCAAESGLHTGTVADKAASALAWSRVDNRKVDEVNPCYVDYEPFLQIIQKMLNKNTH